MATTPTEGEPEFTVVADITPDRGIIVAVYSLLSHLAENRRSHTVAFLGEETVKDMWKIMTRLEERLSE